MQSEKNRPMGILSSWRWEAGERKDLLKERCIWCDPGRRTGCLKWIEKRSGQHGASCVLLTLSCLSATPWTVAHQAPLSMGFSRQEYWSGLPCPPPGDLPDPGIESRAPTMQAGSLPSEPIPFAREANRIVKRTCFLNPIRSCVCECGGGQWAKRLCCQQFFVHHC